MLEKEIRALADREAIRDVLNLYSDAVDRWEIDLYDEIFTQDVHSVYNYNELHGIEELKNYFKTLGYRGPLKVNMLLTRMHFNGNITFKFDGDTARTETYLLALNSSDSGKMLVRGNKYQDQWVRTEAGWRIKDRRHMTEWMFDAPVQLDPDRKG